MRELKHISIRGRMAYLICSFEKLLLYYHCDKEEWRIVVEKLWTFTSNYYLDKWLYEFAEYMPGSVLEDTMDDAEYITEEEFEHLKRVYRKANQDILSFLDIIFECGTCELYTTLQYHSPDTLKIIKKALNILEKNHITPVDMKPFKKYKYFEYDGWGKSFDGRELSMIL